MDVSLCSTFFDHQFGLATFSQLRTVASRQEISTLATNGILIRLRRGVYRAVGSEHSWQQRIAAAVIDRDDVVISRKSAAQLWGISPFAVSTIEVSTQGYRRTLPHVTCHETNLLPDAHIAEKNGLTLTTPARTLFDLSDTWGASSMQWALNRALDKQLVTIPELLDCFELMGSQGRRGSGRFFALLAEYADDDPHCRSFLERKAHRIMKKAGLPDAVAQYEVLFRNKYYVIDFAYPSQKIAIEIDGFSAHGNRRAFHADKPRDIDLLELGWTVLHFSSQTLNQIPRRVRHFLDREPLAIKIAS